MARKARSVVDTVLGEAGGRTRAQRYADMRAIASVISNRSTLLGVTPESVVSAPGQFSAYGAALPPGVESYRGLAQQAIDSVAQWGPSHFGTFYATPEAVDNLPGGLTQVTATTAHTYFDDPQNRSISVGRNKAKRPSQIEKQALANMTDYANAMDARFGPSLDENTADLTAQDRAAQIAAQDFDARAVPAADTVASVSSTPTAMTRSVPSLNQTNEQTGQFGTGLAAKAAMAASPMQNVSLSKTSRSVPALSDFDNRFSTGFTNDISSPLNKTASTQSDLTGTQNARLSNALRTGQIQSQLSQTRSVPSLADVDTTASTTRSVPSFADKKAQAYAGAATALNAQREGYTTAGSPTGAALSAATAVGDDGTPGRTSSVSKSAPTNSGFGTAGASGFGVGGTTDAGGWGDTARSMFGSISDAVGEALGGLSATGTGANLTGRVSSPVSASATAGAGLTAGQGASKSFSVGTKATPTAAQKDALSQGLTNQANTTQVSDLDGHLPGLTDRWAGPTTAVTGSIDNTTASISNQPLNNATRDFTRKQNVVTPTVDVADDITPSYKAPTIATAYADDVTPSVPTADVTPTSSRTTRTRTAVSVPDKRDTLSDVNAGGATGLSPADLNAPDGLTARSNLGPRAATTAGSMIGSMVGGPFGAIAGALAGNAMARAGQPAGGYGGFLGGLFGGTRSPDGLSGRGPGGKGPGGTGGGSKGSRGPGASSSSSRGGSNKGEQGSRR